MKKKRYLILLLALLLLLPACGRENHRVEGTVTQVQTSESGELTAFVVQVRGGEETGVLLDESTDAIPAEPGGWTTSGMRAEFQKDLQLDVTVFASCLPNKQKLTAGDGRELTAYQAEIRFWACWFRSLKLSRLPTKWFSGPEGPRTHSSSVPSGRR